MRRADDTGSVSVLVVGLAVIAVALIGVVANASRVFLRDRALTAAADGAAVAAAGVVRPAGSGEVTLAPAAARAEVERYVAGADLAARFGPGFRYDVATSGSAVTVTLHASVPLAFLPSFAGGPGGVGLSAAATARSVLLP